MLITDSDRTVARIEQSNADRPATGNGIELAVTDIPRVARWLSGSYSGDEWPPETRLAGGTLLYLEPALKPELWLEQWSYLEFREYRTEIRPGTEPIRRLRLFEEDIRTVVQWLLELSSALGVDAKPNRVPPFPPEGGQWIAFDQRWGTASVLRPRLSKLPYPIENLFYAGWQTREGYLRTIRGTLGSVRLTAQELQAVLTDVRENRERLASSMRWRRRKQEWLPHIFAWIVFAGTFVVVARDLLRLGQPLSTLTILGPAVVAAGVALLGFKAWMWSRRLFPNKVGDREQSLRPADRDPVRWGQVFGEAETLLSTEIELRRQSDWNPPDDYGTPPRSSAASGWRLVQ